MTKKHASLYMTFCLEMEWEYSGRMGGDGKAKNR